MTERQKHLLILGVAFVAAGGYIAVSWTGWPNTGPSNKAPSNEGEGQRTLVDAGLSAGTTGIRANANFLGLTAEGGFTQESRLMHFFVPNGPMPVNPPNIQYTNTKHRYPTVTGTNINTLIHRGMQPLAIPSGDPDWMSNPPSERN